MNLLKKRKTTKGGVYSNHVRFTLILGGASWHVFMSVSGTSVSCLCIRKEFVEAYLCYIFSDSVSEQYSAFSAGFLKVCGGEILSLFQPSELMAMVVGNSNYNWEVMEKVRFWVGHTLGSPMMRFVL